MYVFLNSIYTYKLTILCMNEYINIKHLVKYKVMTNWKSILFYFISVNIRILLLMFKNIRSKISMLEEPRELFSPNYHSYY